MDCHLPECGVQSETAIPNGRRPGLGRTPNGDSRPKAKLLKLGAPETIKACYEAGPTGYGLYSDLLASGICCEVVAPAKTDKREAPVAEPEKVIGAEAKLMPAWDLIRAL